MASLQIHQPFPTAMESWPEACFKAYDIRGFANADGTGELTPEFAYRLGRALATYLECESFAVGTSVIHPLLWRPNSWLVWLTVAFVCSTWASSRPDAFTTPVGRSQSTVA